MSEISLQDQFKLKELELNSLLEITQAINENLPEDFLYKIFNFTLRGNLNIKRLALYVLDNVWECKVNYGTEHKFEEIIIGDEFLEIPGFTKIKKTKNPAFEEFDFCFPVLHKKHTLAVVFVGGMKEGQDDEVEEGDTTFLQAFTNIMVVAIENKRLAARQLVEEAFRKELEIAKNVQKFLFPENLPYGIRLKIEASYIPHQSVGGDYYDYIPINRNQFLICIADVSGKGIPAALIMSNFQASLRTLVRQTPNISEIVQALNFQLLQSAKGENFITFFGAIYDHKLKTMVYVNAGHNHPLLITKKDGVRHLDEGCTVLGAFDPLPFINEGFITDLDEFLLFLYTDGMVETSNEQGEEYGDARLQSFLEKHSGSDLREIHSNVMNDLDDFKGSNVYLDDITLLSCKLEP